MITDLREHWLELAAKDENSDIETIKGYYDGKELKELDKKFAGKIALLKECQYGESIAPDYFLVEDNNFVIFPDLFEEVSE